MFSGFKSPQSGCKIQNAKKGHEEQFVSCIRKEKGRGSFTSFSSSLSLRAALTPSTQIHLSGSLTYQEPMKQQGCWNSHETQGQLSQSFTDTILNPTDLFASVRIAIIVHQTASDPSFILNERQSFPGDQKPLCFLQGWFMQALMWTALQKATRQVNREASLSS